ncbi:MAG: 3-deoxy-8-phosphooctulonate synthase [Elusimicrobiota bacterium]|nr:3-deoxy-8-phosphooctulonate synthase [Elusimicrobiota bacterium]
MEIITIDKIKIGTGEPLVLIAGPCVIETEEITLKTAEEINKITTRLNMPFIFKSSYDKANRLSIDSYRGPGVKKGLKTLRKVKTELKIPLLVDVHLPQDVVEVASVADILQIPAFLCRQTDLAVACAKTDRVINIKKGQFLAPWDMKHIIEKIEKSGSKKILLTERGTSFGYNNLVCDMRSIPIMQSFGYPVIFDAGHSVQLPGAQGKSSGGMREMIFPLTRAAVACGCDGLFVEVHPEPEKALSDAQSMLPVDKLEELLVQVKQISELVRNREKNEMSKMQHRKQT